MLQSIISSKVEKSKQNIDNYLSSSSQAPQGQQQRDRDMQGQAMRQNQQTASSTSQSQNNPVTPGNPATVPSSNNTASSTNKNSTNKQLAKNQIQVKIMNVGGKQYNKEGMMFRFSKQQARFQFVFQEDSVKTKLQAKRESLSGKRVKANYADSSCAFEVKQAIYKKQDTKQSSLKGTTVWTNGKQANQITVVIWLKDKQQLKPLMESSFMEGLYDANSAGSFVETPKNIELQPIDEGMQADEDHASIKLSIPTAAQQAESQKARKIIKQMKQDDKTTILMEVFKIKKQYDDPNNAFKRLKCPVYSCDKKSYKDSQQLKNHLKMKHPELGKHGIELSEYDGTFEYGNKAMDLALFIGKMFPQEMKKIIKQMKTKQAE